MSRNERPKIASHDEARIIEIMLESTIKYMEENHIIENSDKGKSLKDFEKHLENDLISDLIYPSKN